MSRSRNGSRMSKGAADRNAVNKTLHRNAHGFGSHPIVPVIHIANTIANHNSIEDFHAAGVAQIAAHNKLHPNENNFNHEPFNLSTAVKAIAKRYNKRYGNSKYRANGTRV